jgi:hypothetical protein
MREVLRIARPRVDERGEPFGDGGG